MVQRRRRQEGMPGEERAWNSPKQRPGWEGSGSLSSQSQFDSDQGGVVWGVSRQSGLGQRGAGAESPQSSDRQQRPTGSQQDWSRPTFFSGGWNPGEGQAETESHGRGEQGSDFGREEGSPRRSPSPVEAATSAPAAQSLRWTPREQLVQYWMRCRATLKNRLREQLMAFCPRPTLPDRSSEVPVLNPEILCLFSAKQVKEIESLSRPLRVLQNEVLDMLAPAMTIYEMAEEAMERGESVDPMELREWTRRLIRYIGSISHRLTLQRRIQVLGTLNPRLKMVSSKMASRCTDGKLFAEDKVKLLKEIVKRFPQLTVSQNRLSARRYQLAARRPPSAATWQRRFPPGPHSRPRHPAAHQSPAGQRGSENQQ
ncbi:uncharacterized protein LOC123025244 [Varanus komodoensis]|uniref:uncharacterized protein LOC123025244 n=1 Tax=Varanus komodoensis TaxID=61221 RepID=UPI001CF790D2|nr:uncharacterized protein LOC123025244 [Varanus komodoensis]